MRDTEQKNAHASGKTDKSDNIHNLDDSQCDTHKHNVLNDWVPNSHIKIKLFLHVVLAESSLVGW